MVTLQFHFEKLQDGKVLRITLPGNGEYAKAEIAELLEKVGSDSTFMELTESYWTNGWGVHNADTLGQMSECLVVAEESTIEDDGSISLSGKVWTNIHNYQVYCPIEEILENGHIDFYLWEDFKSVENFKIA